MIKPIEIPTYYNNKPINPELKPIIQKINELIEELNAIKKLIEPN